MTRTRPLLLIVLWAVAGLAAFLADTWLVSNGRPAMQLPATLGVVLAAIGVLVVAAAWPVRQAVRQPKRRVGFQHATRVLGMAKASSVVAAVSGGWATGALLYLLTRPVLPGASLTMALVAVAGAVVLLVAALLAESWCVLPPDGDDAAAA